MRTYIQRMMFFLGGLFSLGVSTSIGHPATVPESPVYVPAPTPAAKRVKNRHMRPHLQYSADLPRFPVTRQVMRAELRAMAFKQTAHGLLKNEPRHDRRFASVKRINVRSFIAGFSWGGMLTHDQLVWCRAWARKSGRLFYYEREA